MKLERRHLPSDACYICGTGWVDLDVAFSCDLGRVIHAVCFLGTIQTTTISEPVVIVDNLERNEVDLLLIEALHEELEKAHEAFKRGDQDINQEDYPALTNAVNLQLARLKDFLETER